MLHRRENFPQAGGPSRWRSCPVGTCLDGVAGGKTIVCGKWCSDELVGCG